MTTGQDRCGLSCTSILPMSCRGRAEAFARRLHSRLRSLGSQDGNGAADESSWLAGHETSLALSQPRQSTEAELYLVDFNILESPGTPEEEIEPNELDKLINKSKFAAHGTDCHCPVIKDTNVKLANGHRITSTDSDSSEGSFYDTEQADLKIGLPISDCTDDGSETKDEQEDLYVTSSECTIAASSSLSDDLLTISLKDDDCSSIDGSSSLELPPHPNDTEQASETYTSCLSVDRDLTIECPSKVIANESIHIDVTDCSTSNGLDDDLETDERIPRVRRCSSLKTGKTPPGTPGRKKIVRFADVLGLDLADVRTFLDEIPKIPNSAYNDLIDVDLNDSETTKLLASLKFHGMDRILVPLFQQPGGQTNFLDKVRENLVCLENALVEDVTALSIRGTVRVRNLDFNKSVHIRYSLDSWQSFADVQAVYVENSCDGFSDKFAFLVYAHNLTVGQRIEFAARFQCKGSQFWDNNGGANYCFQCLPATNTSYVSTTAVDDGCRASFY